MMEKMSRQGLTVISRNVYLKIIPEKHFLRLLKEKVNFEFVNDIVKHKYSPDQGRPSWPPELLAKMLLLQFLYDISDRAVEEAVNFNMAFKYFCDLEVEDVCPDSTTLVRFRSKLGDAGCRDLFNEMVKTARKSGLVADKLSIVDSSAIKAKVDTYKNPPSSGNGPDNDARGGYKSKTKPFFGYKYHIAEDFDSELITKVTLMPGNTYDGDGLIGVLEENARIVTADKGYNSEDNHWLLESSGQIDAIIPRSKLRKEMMTSPDAVAAMKQRSNVERKFSEMKHHGMGRCRYWGFGKTEIQMYLTATVVNIKRMMKLLCGSAPPRKSISEFENSTRIKLRTVGI